MVPNMVRKLAKQIPRDGSRNGPTDCAKTVQNMIRKWSKNCTRKWSKTWFENGPKNCPKRVQHIVQNRGLKMVPNGGERRRASTVFVKQTIMPRCNMARPNWYHISVCSRRRCCSAAGNPDVSAACSTFHSCAVNLHPPKMILLSHTASQCETQRRRSPSQSLTAANSCMYRDAKDTAARCETQRRRSPTEAAVTSTIAQAAMCIHETRKTLGATEKAVTLKIDQGCRFLHTQTRETQRATAGHREGGHHHNCSRRQILAHETPSHCEPLRDTQRRPAPPRSLELQCASTRRERHCETQRQRSRLQSLKAASSCIHKREGLNEPLRATQTAITITTAQAAL